MLWLYKHVIKQVIYFVINSIFNRHVAYVRSILGGVPIDIKEAPYHIGYGDLCSGVLIHSRWAITTVHCGSNITHIRVGSTYWREGEEKLIANHIVHPKYGIKHVYDYDIQLLELSSDVKLGDTILPIKISDGLYSNNIYVTGWGYTKEKTDFVDILLRARIEPVEKADCQEVGRFWYNHTLTKRMFCAGGDKADACQGDSGGGATSLGKLIGISSFGFGCGRNIPGVYVNISSKGVRTWLRRKTGIPDL